MLCCVLQFHEFVEYLKSRQRAGVVKVPPYASSTGFKVWPRLLHILPLTFDNCDLLGLPDLSELPIPNSFPRDPAAGDIQGLLGIVLPLNPIREH